MKGRTAWREMLRECGNVLGDPYKEEFLYLVNLLERGR